MHLFRKLAVWTWGVVLCLGTPAVAEEYIPLIGEWAFALDPAAHGEKAEWHKPERDWTGQSPAPSRRWDTVTVPHCWSVDPRYEHTGKVWYRRSVLVPAAESSSRYRIEFESVFYRARVWVNGQLVGEHEGGYTPFSFDVSSTIVPGRHNLIAVEVDNSWSTSTLPGARPGNLPADQMYPWWNFGGITRPARLVVHRPLHITDHYVVAHQNAAPAKGDADPARVAGSANVSVTAELRNDGDRPAVARATATLRGPDDRQIGGPLVAEATLAPGEVRSIALNTVLAPDQVRLWSVSSPTLYAVTVEVQPAQSTDPADRSTASSRFGIRTVVAESGRLLLNALPVRLAGANRVMDHPVFGSTEPDDLVAGDLGLMKDAHLQFARLQHYPLAKNILDWADRHGMLIIAEVPAWQLKSSQLADPAMQSAFKAQMLELMRSARGHPSVIGWSVGNEYESWTPEGVAWTREMSAFVREQDPTRPVVFAAIGTEVSKIAEKLRSGKFERETSSFHYSDILCLNVYAAPADVARSVDLVHSQWPDKPMLLTEYGTRTDQVPAEADRITHFRGTLDLVKARPYVCGLAYWAFNDYRSRYPGSDKTGYRRWGIVDEQRKPRGLYAAMAEALTPVKLTATRTGNTVEASVLANDGFPSLTLYQPGLRVVTADGTVLATRTLSDIAPGERAAITLDLPADMRTGTAIEVILFDVNGHRIARTPVN